MSQNDPDRAARRAALARARREYQWAHAYRCAVNPAGVSICASPPPDDQFSAPFMTKVALVDLRLMRNHSAADLDLMLGGTLNEIAGNASMKPSLLSWLGVTRQIGTKSTMFSEPFKAATSIARSFPPNLQRYQQAFKKVPLPATSEKLADPSQWNKLFAWQRLAGANPFVLTGIRHIEPPLQLVGDEDEGVLEDLGEAALDTARAALARLRGRADNPPDSGPAGSASPAPRDIPGVLPRRFPVTNEIYRSVMGPHDSLERAAREHRLYLADYRLLDGLPQGKWHDGALGIERSKYIYAPMALFAWRPDSADELGELVPVAIQCHQEARADRPNPIFTPHDGARWKMACSVVQCADANHHEFVWHLGRSHIIMEAAYVAARRTLAPNHPMMRLIAQHCEFTLSINDYAVNHLVAPGGQVDLLFGSTLDGTLTILSRALAETRLDQLAPDKELASRLVDDLEGLPRYPYRDDALRLWPPLKRWFDAYTRLYYGSDSDVIEDREIQAFVEELGSPQGGNIHGVHSLRTVADVVDLVSTLAWIGSAQHSAVNYTQYPYFGYCPNSPLALFGEAPTASTPDNDDNWIELLAPAQDILLQLDIAFQLSGVKWRRICDYKDDAFQDPRVQPYLDRLHRELATVERQMTLANETRYLPYPYLFPSNAQNSIFI